jgi:ABC-type glutathione transport system ATPase component
MRDIASATRMKTPPPIFTVENVSKRYRMRNGETHLAVNDVSFAVGAGEIVALVGESGSGKTSLAKICLALMQPDVGRVTLKGRSLTDASPQELRRSRVAMQPVFQDSSSAFNPRRTVENILRQATKGRSGMSSQELRTHAIGLLEQVRLLPGEQFLKRLPHELSGGQRQRLAIARALAMEPELIIADEPLSGADVSIRGQVLNLFLDIRAQRNVAYLFITHDISIARAFAERVLVMYKGELVEQGYVEDVIDNPQHPYTQRLVSAALAGRRAIDEITSGISTERNNLC